MTRTKQACFRLITLTPLLILVYLVIRLSVDVHRINGIDEATTLSRLETYLKEKQGTTVALPEALQKPTDSNFVVFVFGESSVVLSDGPTFSEYLGRDLAARGIPADVRNFGVSGFDSYSIRLRLKQALAGAGAKPALAVFYMGHNEFNNAYDSILKKDYPDFEYLLKPFYFFAPKKDPRILAPMEYYWYARLRKPALIDVLQRVNLVRIGDSLHDAYDELILDRFRKHVEDMLSHLADARIPALIVTPIGNYSAKPFGNKVKVNDNYERGIDEKDYEKSLSYLIAAKDHELLTYDIRAKSRLNDYLLSLESPKVLVIDLERECRHDKFRFDDSNFLDYFHLKASAHRMIADKIVARISKTDLLPRPKQ